LSNIFQFSFVNLLPSLFCFSTFSSNLILRLWVGPVSGSPVNKNVKCECENVNVSIIDSNSWWKTSAKGWGNGMRKWGRREKGPLKNLAWAPRA